MKKIIYIFIFLLPLLLFACAESDVEFKTRQLEIAQQKNQELKLDKELALVKEQNQALIEEAEAKAIEDAYSKGKELYVSGNYEEAVKWWRLAADQGHVSAQNNLGILFENGLGVTQSDSEAVKLYKLAVDQGHDMALDNLKRITNQ